MSHRFSNNLWNVLVCPYCKQKLKRTKMGGWCNNCQATYHYTDSGAIDLRPNRFQKIQHEYQLGVPLFSETGFSFDVLHENNSPEVDYSNIHVPQHLSKQLMSYFPKAKREDSLMLDLGCGSTIHRDVCEFAGFEYVGLDYDSEKAPILGDAHTLPFEDKSFEFILSIAVLEHIRYPFVMMKEAYRVLKPNGQFIGTVAFNEPFHDDSFYHHTHLGTYNSLKEGGFKIEYIAPSDEWSVLVAQARMGLFPSMPHLLSKLIVLPIHVLHKVWWCAYRKVNNKVSKSTRIVNTTGAFTFIARRQVCI